MIASLRTLIVCLSLLAVAAAFPSGLARAATSDSGARVPLLLRSSVMIDGSFIRLGDLFDGDVADPQIPIARAPAPGESLVLDAGWLAELAHARGLAWRPATEFDQVVVGRRSQTIGEPAIKNALVQALVEHGLDQDVQIELGTGKPTLVLPTDVAPTIAIQQLSVDAKSGRFSATIVAPADGPAAARTTVYGEAFTTVEVPVVARRAVPGEVILADDIAWVPVRADRIGANTLTDASQIVGKTPRRPIRANELLRASDLQTETTIKKGSLVAVIYSTGQMTLTVQGRAMADGAQGGPVRVMNTKSNRVIDAMVVDARTVRVNASAGGLGL